MLFSWMVTLAAAAGPAAPEGAATQGSGAQSVPTLQQRFDTATEAAVKGDCRGAIELFEGLERDPRLKPGSLSAAAIAVRKGSCLVRTGRLSDGESAILKGLPRLEQAGKSFAIDVSDARDKLGDAAMGRWDYDGAKRNYRLALEGQIGADRLPSLARLAKASAFDGDETAFRPVDEGLRIATTDPTVNKDRVAEWRTLRARTLFNQGRNEEAYVELKAALALSGGLTLKTSVAEASMRGDLALAALLLGRKDDARNYMAYTGQGRIEKSPFAVAAIMNAPECGEVSGLRPEDFAVVEFGIGDNGSVYYARTIYSRGGPAVAAAFAKAVADWVWPAEAVKDTPAFYRVAARVELRCSASSGPARDIGKDLNDRFDAWAAKQTGIRTAGDTPRQIALAELSRILSQPRDTLPLERYAAAVGQEMILQATSAPEIVPRLDYVLGAPDAAKLPPEVVNTLRYYRVGAAMVSAVSGRKRVGDDERAAFARELLAFGDSPGIGADPLLVATAKLAGATLGSSKALSPEGIAAIQQVADDSRLSPHDRLRQFALLRLANAAAAKNDIATAQSFFQRTGLTEQQCALLGPTPTLRKSGAGADDFPNEAMAYGFEGWVRLEFDIKADGKTVGTRAVIAYPPFVFVDAATRMSSGMRFEASYRPSGSVACSANNQTIRFILGQ